MAQINKSGAVKAMTGMPSKGSILAAGGDNVPAVITDQQGAPMAPAAIKEGEIVFSVPAVVGAGNGNYDEGAAFLLELHEQLKAVGEQVLSQEEQGGMGGIAGGLGAV